MVQSISKTELPSPFPDHTQLPDEDGTFVKNFQEHPQSLLLTDSLSTILSRLHPDGQYCIGQDCGIYWRETDPPERGAEAPDWFYVPNVPPDRDGQIRRSYVLWRELMRPAIVLEFASGDGSEERDRTPLSRSSEGDRVKPGKFWVYEQIVRTGYYGIFIVTTGELEMYRLVGDVYEPMIPNDRGHYPIVPMQVELGIWQGTYQNQSQRWLRWWDLEGNLLAIGQELARQERQKRLELIEKLRSLSPEQLQALGINSDDLS
ncbi:MAG: Uma2 family endonuclease [Cyanobacteria bacterium SBLK]|nr:Uma2 family endonuclease [Cyanobacteria bacterium SBLK]